jgi:hypothetical protein
MTTLAHTAQTAGRIAKRVTVGSPGKTAAAVAVVGLISAVSVGLWSGAPFTPAASMELANQTELRDRLCQIYRHCTHQTELRDLLCRIEHRCPSTGEASRMQTAEITAR